MIATGALVTVSVSRTLKGQPEQVFDAWIDQEKIGQWIGAPGRQQGVRVEVDAQVGGKFSFVNLSNVKEIIHFGEYFEISRPRRLVFSWGSAGQPIGNGRVTLDIGRERDGTLLQLVHTGARSNLAEATEMRWREIITTIAGLL